MALDAESGRGLSVVVNQLTSNTRAQKTGPSYRRNFALFYRTAFIQDGYAGMTEEESNALRAGKTKAQSSFFSRALVGKSLAL